MCICHLLRQPVYILDRAVASIVEHNTVGKRMYGEMHTGDGWQERQVCRLFRIVFVAIVMLQQP